MIKETLTSRKLWLVVFVILFIAIVGITGFNTLLIKPRIAIPGFFALPPTLCSDTWSPNGKEACIKDYEERTGEKYDQTAAEDWHAYETIYNIRCDLSFAITQESSFKLVPPEEYATPVQTLTNTCNSIKAEKLRAGCLKMLNEKLVCITTDSKYCSKNDNMCLGVLTGDYQKCETLTYPDLINNCLYATVKYQKLNDPQICDRMVYKEQATSRKYEKTEFQIIKDKCYWEIAIRTKNVELCSKVSNAVPYTPITGENCLNQLRITN